MQNATKKLVASLGVALIVFGITGAANAANTHNVMVKTYKDDGSFRVLANDSKLTGLCLKGKAGIWMNGKIAAPNNKHAMVFYYTDSKCSSTSSRNSGLRKVPGKDGLVNYWVDTPRRK